MSGNYRQRLGRSPQSWVFLAGSGISVGSGLPTGWTFNSRIAGFFGRSPRERRYLASLLTTSRGSSRETLRFEQVIQVLREIAGDQDLAILDAFDDPGPPTELHFFLSSMLRRGAGVLTTNFDSLIERAYLSSA